VLARQQADWPWSETTLGQALLCLPPIFAASTNPAIKRIGTPLAPTTQMYRLAGGYIASGQ